jgi:hypothetical protein
MLILSFPDKPVKWYPLNFHFLSKKIVLNVKFAGKPGIIAFWGLYFENPNAASRHKCSQPLDKPVNQLDHISIPLGRAGGCGPGGIYNMPLI